MGRWFPHVASISGDDETRRFFLVGLLVRRTRVIARPSVHGPDGTTQAGIIFRETRPRGVSGVMVGTKGEGADVGCVDDDIVQSPDKILSGKGTECEPPGGTT